MGAGADVSTSIKLEIIDNFRAFVENADKAKKSIDGFKVKPEEINSGLKNIGEMGDKFDRIGSASLRAASSLGTMSGQARAMGSTIADVGDLADRLLSNGFNPMNLAITGMIIAVPTLISVFVNAKDTMSQVNEKFQNFKEKLQSSKENIFALTDQIKSFNDANLSLSGNLENTARAYQGMLSQQKAVNEEVKKYSTKNMVDEAKRFIDMFNQAGPQSGKLFEGLKFDDSLIYKLKTIPTAFTLIGATFKDITQIFNNPEIKSAVNSLFSDENVVSYFQKAKLAGEDFGTAYWKMLKQVMGMTDAQIQQLRKENPQLYNEWWNQAQAFYKQKMNADDTEKKYAAQKALEQAQARSDANKSALDSSISYYKSLMDSGDFYYDQEKHLDDSAYAQKVGNIKNHTEFAKMNYEALLQDSLNYRIKDIENSKADEEEKRILRKIAKSEFIKDLEEMMNKEAKIQGKTVVFEIEFDERTNKKIIKELNIHEQAIKRMSKLKPFDAFDSAFDKIDTLEQINNKLMTMNDYMGNAIMTTLGTLGQAFSETFEAIGAGSDITFRALAYNALKGISVQAGQMAVMELAAGIAATAGGVYTAAAFGNPGSHFAAAAIFAGISAGAGLAAGATKPKEKEEEEKVKAPKGLSGSGTNTQTASVQVNVYGSMYKDRMEEVQESMTYIGKKLAARSYS